MDLAQPHHSENFYNDLPEPFLPPPEILKSPTKIVETTDVAEGLNSNQTEILKYH